MLKIDQNYLDEIKNAFMALGFSEQEALNQLQDLTKIIKAAILERIALENPTKREDILADPEVYVKNHFSGDYFEKEVKEILNKTVEEYLSAVTVNVDNFKKEQFLANLEAASAGVIISTS